MSEAVPRRTLVRRFDTHRLIPAKHLGGSDSVLIYDLDHATNDRLLSENGRLTDMGPRELVFDVPSYRVVNAAFTHPHPLGSRFNGPQRGAWYAAFELRTSQAEIVFHKTTEYTEIGRFDDSVTYDDYLADVSAELHDLRGDARFASCLSKTSYVASQALAERLLETASLGVVYPSVRRSGGTCVCCFRPSLVANVRRSHTYRFTWAGKAQPTIRRI